MNPWNDSDLLSVYNLHQAIMDGILVEIFKNRWGKLSGGKPIVATAHLASEVSPAALLEIWNGYVAWRRTVEPTLPEAERLFSTKINGESVWVIEDADAFTLMYPVDY